MVTSAGAINFSYNAFQSFGVGNGTYMLELDQNIRSEVYILQIYLNYIPAFL